MTAQLLDSLSRLAARRFGSFAEAAKSILDLLEAVAPATPIVLTQVDWESGEFRVIDARGGHAARGLSIPLAREVPADASAVGQLVDGDALAALGPGPWGAAPLDAADGQIVGLLLASGSAGQAPPRELAQLLLLAARLLSYEWESVSTRAELRRLAELARDRSRTDAVTGLPDCEALLESIDREWELCKRGTVDSYLVVCQIRELAGVTERVGHAAANLLLKEVAEVLAGGVRRTDYLARVGEDRFAALLVGCKGPEGARAFLTRFERALERSADARPAAVSLAYGIKPLAGADSARQALQQAEDEARTASAAEESAA